MRFMHLAALAATLSLSACTIHPLPEDVTGVKTYHIVRQIRCETRNTVRSMLLKFMSRIEHPVTRELVARYTANPAAIAEFKPSLLGNQLRGDQALLNLFWDTGVAYNFDFDMYESNNLDGSVDFIKPLTHGNFTLGLTAAAHRKRENHRQFTVTDTFSKLLTSVPEKYCEGFIVEADHRYPIAGRIGVDKVAADFIELTLFGNLDAKDSTTAGGGAPTLADELTFTTQLTAGINPKVQFTPVGKAFQLLDASLTASADRTDVHKVTIGLAIAKAEIIDVDPVRAKLFSRQNTGIIAGRRVTGGGTRAEQLAVLAVDQTKSREIRIVPSY